jgi:hypothetical protein
MAVGLLPEVHHRGGPVVAWVFAFQAEDYNVARLRTLLARSA